MSKKYGPKGEMKIKASSKREALKRARTVDSLWGHAVAISANPSEFKVIVRFPLPKHKRGRKRGLINHKK